MSETRFEFDGITYDVESQSRRGVTLAISRDGAGLERLTVDLYDLRSRTEALEALNAVDKDVPWFEHLRNLAVNVKAGNGVSPNGVQDASSMPLAACADWPSDASDEAFHGLAGDIVRTLEPHTESDPHALLTISLVAFGNSVGPEPHFRVGQDEHGLRLNAVLVGPTGHGRKGMSQAEITSLFERADPDFRKRVITGLSSGEGLIWAVRDPIYKQEPIKEKGHVVGYQEVQVDAGVDDKRLLVVEPEFARTLKAIRREGNILSAVIRQAWDSGNLRTLTRNNPAVATGAHISIIGHITPTEIRRYLDSTEAANGFGNRILWVAVRRSQFLPEGGSAPEADLDQIAKRLADALSFAATAKEIRRDAEARDIWHAVYPTLSQGKPGLVGAATGRAEAQVMRLASIYALMEQSTVIGAPHLVAALAFWERGEATARYIFGDATGDSVADTILRELRARGPLTQTAIYSDIFSRHVSAERIARALGLLVEFDLVESKTVETEGRPATVWSAKQS